MLGSGCAPIVTQTLNVPAASTQLDAGIRGKAPGAETAAYISALDAQLRVVGGCGMGLLAVAAHAFDAWCLTRVGVTAATSSMLLIASLVSGTITQVRNSGTDLRFCEGYSAAAEPSHTYDDTPMQQLPQS